MHTPNPSHPKAGLQTIFSSPPPLSVFYTLLCGSRVEKVGLLQQPASSHAQKKESPSLLPLPSPSLPTVVARALPCRLQPCPTPPAARGRHLHRPDLGPRATSSRSAVMNAARARRRHATTPTATAKQRSCAGSHASDGAALSRTHRREKIRRFAHW
jgi:hypothetical protein